MLQLSELPAFTLWHIVSSVQPANVEANAVGNLNTTHLFPPKILIGLSRHKVKSSNCRTVANRVVDPIKFGPPLDQLENNSILGSLTDLKTL